MTDGLFHIDAEGNLASMSVTPYEAEPILQELLEKHPDLLAGGQMEPESPRRWLLVKREHGVPDREDSGSRWSVDHVFVDQDAIPTLVEVKRSTDTRIRREVVGQMLDYAANGVRYWPLSELRSAFQSTHENAETELLVQELCKDATLSLDTFFERVEDNLRAGRIRMVFVADVIPDELMRITEFLNEQMNPAQVFAVEVKQYRAGDHSGTVIVPAVFGRTSAASIKTSHRKQQSRDELLGESLPETIEALDATQRTCCRGGAYDPRHQIRQPAKGRNRSHRRVPVPGELEHARSTAPTAARQGIRGRGRPGMERPTGHDGQAVNAQYTEPPHRGWRRKLGNLARPTYYTRAAGLTGIFGMASIGDCSYSQSVGTVHRTALRIRAASGKGSVSCLFPSDFE